MTTQFKEKTTKVDAWSSLDFKIKLEDERRVEDKNTIAAMSFTTGQRASIVFLLRNFRTHLVNCSNHTDLRFLFCQLSYIFVNIFSKLFKLSFLTFLTSRKNTSSEPGQHYPGRCLPFMPFAVTSSSVPNDVLRTESTTTAARRFSGFGDARRGECV